MLITRVERQQNLPEKRRSANQRKLFNIPVDTFAAKTSDRNNKGMNSLQKSKIKMAHLNIRSLKNRNHLIQLRNFAEEENYGIIAISELWLNSTVANAEVEIAGYKLSRLERLNKTGGVCVYTRSSLKTKVLRNLTDFGFRFSPIMASNPARQIEVFSPLCHIQTTRLSYILLCGRFYG